MWTPAPRYSKSRDRWYVRLKGKQYGLGRDYADACRKFAVLIREVGYTGKNGDAHSLARLCIQYLAGHPGSWPKYLIGTFADFAAEVPCTDIPDSILFDYDAALVENGLKPQTRQHMLRYAWRVLRWGVDIGKIKQLPRRPKWPKPVPSPRDLSPSQLHDLLHRMRENPRLRAFTAFMLGTGCRPGEARLATWDEFDLSANTWTLPAHRTKTRVGRTIWLNRYALAALRVMRKHSHSSTHVFTSRLGRPYTKNGLGIMFKKYGVTAYACRHSFAQSALESNDIAIVAKLLGHRGLQTVGVYARVRDSRIRTVYESLTPPTRPARRRKFSAEKPSATGSGRFPIRETPKPTPRKSGNFHHHKAG